MALYSVNMVGQIGVVAPEYRGIPFEYWVDIEAPGIWEARTLGINHAYAKYPDRNVGHVYCRTSMLAPETGNG